MQTSPPSARPHAHPLPWVAVAFVVGLVLARAAPWVRLTAALPLLVQGLRGRRVDRRGVALALCVLSGLGRGVLDEATRARDELGDLVGCTVVLRGVVCEPEVVDSRGCRFIVETRAVACGGGMRQVRARILVSVPSTVRCDAPVHWTQAVTVIGRLERPPELEGFDYAAWLAGRDVFEVTRLRSAGDVSVCGPGQVAPLMRAAAAARRRIEQALERWLPPLQAGLAEGVLLAESRAVPEDVAEAFRATGTFHVLVTAGIHVAFVTAGCIGALALAGVGGARAALLTIPAVAFFALTAGGSPSIVRAAIMGGVALLGHAAGRPASGRRALSLAVLCMTAWNPRLVGDAGFQMSVACVIGILHLAPLIRRHLAVVPAPLRGALAISLATQLMIAPLSALYFGHVSVSGIVANLVVVPLCEVLLALGLLLSALGGLGSALAALGLSDVAVTVLARPLALAAWVDGTLVIGAVRLFRDMPLCTVQVSPPDGREVVLWYGSVWVLAKLAARRRVPEREAASTAPARNGGSA